MIDVIIVTVIVAIGMIKSSNSLLSLLTVVLSRIAFLIELALETAESMSNSNETIYEVNFETGKVRDVRADYYGNPLSWDIDYPFEEILAQVKRSSKAPIRNVQDVYHSLTNRETLDKLLQQP
jgi:hypothetical protein